MHGHILSVQKNMMIMILYSNHQLPPTRHKKNWGAGGLQMSQPASTFLSRGQERRPQIPTFHIAGTL